MKIKRKKQRIDMIHVETYCKLIDLVETLKLQKDSKVYQVEDLQNMIRDLDADIQTLNEARLQWQEEIANFEEFYAETGQLDEFEAVVDIYRECQ